MPKPRALKLGEYEPLPLNAVLSPTGRFYRAGAWEHEKVGEAVSGLWWDDALRAGWLRVWGGIVHNAFIWGNPTQKQIDALFDYAKFMEWPLIEVFDSTCRRRAGEFFGLNGD